MTDNWYETAKKKGLIANEIGVNAANIQAAAPCPCPPKAGISVAKELFRVRCQTATSEAGFQDAVVEFGHYFGWRIVHVRKVLVKMGQNIHWETPFAVDGAGSFDLQFYRERHMMVELKFGKNTPQENQLEWQRRYETAGIENYIWYPSDCEEIIRVLTRGRQEADAQNLVRTENSLAKQEGNP